MASASTNRPKTSQSTARAMNGTPAIFLHSRPINNLDILITTVEIQVERAVSVRVFGVDEVVGGWLARGRPVDWLLLSFPDSIQDFMPSGNQRKWLTKEKATVSGHS